MADPDEMCIRDRYYGDRPWRAPCTIGEAVKVPEEYQEMFSDYRIHVIDVPRLPEEVREKLTSDFRVVADYFAGRKNEDYVPIDQPLKHPEAMLEFLRAVSYTHLMNWKCLKNAMAAGRS